MKTAYIIGAFAFLASCSAGRDYDATGIFEATTVVVAAETSGRIIDMPVSEGDSISRGSVVAVVDTVVLALQRDQIRSQRDAAESSSPDIGSQAASLRTQTSHQEAEVERLRRLVADGAATEKQLADAEASLRSMKGQLGALLSSLGKSRNTISGNARALELQCGQVEEMIARSTVKAPAGGTVLAKYAEPGEYAAPGKPLVKIADLGKVYLRAYFTASSLANVKLGQQVTVIADFGGDNRIEYPGTITWISQESEFTPKSIQTSDTRSNLVYAVNVAVANDGRIKLGQYGEVRL